MSYEAYHAYASPTTVESFEWLHDKESNQFTPYQIPATHFYYSSLPEERYPRWPLHLPFSAVDYFVDQLSLPGVNKRHPHAQAPFFTLTQRIPPKNSRACSDKISAGKNLCGFFKEYTYKVIPSVVKYTDIGLDQLNGYTTTLFATGGEIHYYYQNLLKALTSFEAKLS